MNYIRHLSGFFVRVAGEDRLNPTHISLYMSLFQAWNINRFVNPISISRSEMMGVSKICSKATYHKVMKDLHELGFIRYEPSYNPFRGSAVTLLNFDEVEVQKPNGKHTKKQEGNEPAVGRCHTKKHESTELLNEPYINSINILNSKRCKQQAHDDTSSDFDKTNPQEKKLAGRSLGEGRKRSAPGPPAGASAEAGLSKNKSAENTLPLLVGSSLGEGRPKSIEEVQSFFLQQKSTVIEAEKFYNYFQSNGWKVGGRAPMRDWSAAARNWILNSDKFSSKKPVQALHVSTTKDYGEPL